MLDLDTDPREHLRVPSETGFSGMRDLQNGHPIVHGSVFHLVSEDPATEVSQELLQLQRKILGMAALCSWLSSDFVNLCLGPLVFFDSYILSFLKMHETSRSLRERTRNPPL